MKAQVKFSQRHRFDFPIWPSDLRNIATSFLMALCFLLGATAKQAEAEVISIRPKCAENVDTHLSKLLVADDFRGRYSIVSEVKIFVRALSSDQTEIIVVTGSNSRRLHCARVLTVGSSIQAGGLPKPLDGGATSWLETSKSRVRRELSRYARMAMQSDKAGDSIGGGAGQRIRDTNGNILLLQDGVVYEVFAESNSVAFSVTVKDAAVAIYVIGRTVLVDGRAK